MSREDGAPGTATGAAAVRDADLPQPARRTVLGLGAGLVLGLGTGAVGGRLLTGDGRTRHAVGSTGSAGETGSDPQTSAGASAPGPVDATGSTQAGITRPATPQPHGTLTVLALDGLALDDLGARDSGRRWLAELGDRILALTTAPPADLLPDGAQDLTVTVGLGPRAVRALDRDLPGSTDLAEFAGDDAIPDARLGGDVMIAVYASDAGTTAPVSADLAGLVPGKVRWQQRLYRGPGAGTVVRNPLGFHDGIAVPRTDDELARDVWLRTQDGPPGSDLAGATICVVRRLRLDVDAFTDLPVPGREAVVGRRLADGAPLSGGSQTDDVDLDAKQPDGSYVVPARAHARAAHPSFTGSELMLRRGYAFDDGDDDHGLAFVCFQRSLRTFEATQHRLDEVDDLQRFVTPTASATFLVLPGFSADRPLGSTLTA